MDCKSQKSQATSMLQVATPHQAKHCFFLPTFPSVPTVHTVPYPCPFGKLASRTASSLESQQEADGHTSTLSCLWADRQQRLYIFKGSHFWEVAPDGNVSEPRPLQERWVGLPPNIEAAAVSLEDGDFYFFKGTGSGAAGKTEP